MNKTIKNKKLSLNREVLKALNEHDLSKIAAGKTEVVCSASGVCICTNTELKPTIYTGKI
jgi:hypothetical protein